MNWLPLAIGILVVAALVILSQRSYRKGKRRLVADEPEGTPYRVYTTEFDQVVSSADLPAALPKISPDVNLILSNHAWTSSISESEKFYELMRADREKLNTTLEVSELSYSDVAVTILVDQSGSMKGAPMAFTVAALRHFSETLTSFSIWHEILGFSTAGWKGGFARLKWQADGRPERPGRLCALSHIVYKQGEEKRLETEAWRVMLHPDILRENIDGEAIDWAANRLSNQAERTKILLILSDGAPVDDSTLSVNGPSFLERHILAVIKEVENDDDMRLGAVGIGYAVDRYYQTSVVAHDASQILDAMRRLTARMLSPS